VVRIDIPNAVAINFANSQYDTNAIFLIDPNTALDHQRVAVVTPLLEMHGPIHFTARRAADLRASPAADRPHRTGPTSGMSDRCTSSRLRRFTAPSQGGVMIPFRKLTKPPQPRPGP
jgi:hypothetical protein